MGEATGAPDNTWGSGKLDVAAAIDQARVARFPKISNVRVDGATLSWDTDMPSTSALRFHAHQRQLRLGNSLGTQEDRTPRTQHRLTLAGLGASSYYCEILAHFSGGLVDARR